eukprot:455410-Prymnesium_polylepis.1
MALASFMSMLASTSLVLSTVRLPNSPRVPASPRLDASADNLFAQDGWAPLQEALDQLPVWACANAEGLPLQYERDGSPLALFYADIEEAQEELAASREMYPDLGVDLIPVGLGQAYKLTCEAKALLMPGKEQLKVAKGPGGSSWPSSAVVPLFGCLEMSQPQEDGSPMLPLFLSNEDAEKAVAKATAQMEGEVELEIISLPLERAIELL